MVNLPKVTQLARRRAKITTEVLIWFQNLCSCPLHCTAAQNQSHSMSLISKRHEEKVTAPLPAVDRERGTRQKRNSPNLEEHCEHLEIEESSPLSSTVTVVLTEIWPKESAEHNFSSSIATNLVSRHLQCEYFIGLKSNSMNYSDI